MNDKKKLAFVAVALVMIIAISVAVYNTYKDRIDPITGKITGASRSLAGVSVASNEQKAAAAVSQAPDFTMQDASGNAVKLSSFKGKPVVLNFWTSWCDYCKNEMPYFESAYKQYGDKVQFVMLNDVKSERGSEDGKNFISSSGYTFPVFYETEGKAMSLYGLRGFPATMFIDANGNIVSRNIGEITQDKLSAGIQSLVG